MKYQTYWSILDAPTNAIKSTDVFLSFALISIVAWILIKFFLGKFDDQVQKAILLSGTAIVTVLCLAAFVYLKFFTIDNSDYEINKLLLSSDVGKVEGYITNFKSYTDASRRGNVTIESFSVDSINFRYEDALLGKFNSFSKTKNGIFHNGLPIKITYRKVDKAIMKVEIGYRVNNYSP